MKKTLEIHRSGIHITEQNNEEIKISSRFSKEAVALRQYGRHICIIRKTRFRSVAHAAVLSSPWKPPAMQFTLCVLHNRGLPCFAKCRRSQTVFLH